MFHTIPWFEDIYLISRKGEIKSLIWKEKILKNQINNKGYLYITLWKWWIQYRRLIHRLVALVFVPNPHNYPCVLHLDSIPTNVAPENLRWGTQRENLRQRDSEGKNYCKWRFWSENHSSKRVGQYSLLGNLMAEFGSIREAMRETGVRSNTISKVCLWKQKATGWFIWKHL